MTKWVKPNGAKISINDSPSTIEKAISLGWKTEEQAETEAKAKAEAEAKAKAEAEAKAKAESKVKK